MLWPLRWLRLTVYIGSIAIFVFYTACTVAQVVIATPGPHETWFSHMVSSGPRTVLPTMLSSAIGLAIDIVLLVVPLTAMHQLHLLGKRKEEVFLIFLFGFT